jgi:hypothetical protein
VGDLLVLESTQTGTDSFIGGGGVMNRRLIIVVFAVVALLTGLALAACDTDLAPGTGSSATTETGSPTTGGPSTSTETVPPPNTGGPYVAPDYLDAQPVDLAAITNLDQASLSDAEKQILARQSFVAVVQSPQNGPWKFWQVYETARYQGLPVLVTTDSLLNSYHGLFDTLLQRMEEGALYDQAVVMTQSLYNHAYDQWNAATDQTVKSEARLNLVYFAVGSALLDPTARVPAELQDEVAAEVALIDGAAGPAESPNLGYTEDYSQYKPRGHYTRSEKLERYFKAMMWYGHTAFYINPRMPDVTEEEAASLTRRAILVSSSLVDEAREAWMAIYEPTSFLVGRADDLSIDDMDAVLAEVFGSAQPQPDALTDSAKIAQVRQALNELPAPKIQSAIVREPGDTEDREASERSFRVMGQRYIPDSYAFQQLVWAYVGTEAQPREYPMGLDVMTVLGSDQAYAIEKADFGQDQYANWESQVAKLVAEFAGRSPEVWPTNVYTGWLEALQHVMAMPAEGAPAFMRTQAWARKSLNAALGSWTELRHDTILYAKQSVVAEGEGGEELPVPGYVEPYPAFYAKIAELATTLADGLATYELADAETAEKLETMIWMAETLQAIAEKELAGEALNLEDYEFIELYGQYLEGLEHFDSTREGETLSPGAEKSPVVADVHTNYNADPPQALEEATGYPLVLYTAFELDGQLQLFAGASYAYYEFTADVDKRLTDEEWIALLESGTHPPRPAWTNEWIVEP